MRRSPLSAVIIAALSLYAVCCFLIMSAGHCQNKRKEIDASELSGEIDCFRVGSVPGVPRGTNCGIFTVEQLGSWTEME